MSWGLLLADADSSFSLPLSRLKAPRRHFLSPPPASRELFVADNCSVGAGLLGVGGCRCSLRGAPTPARPHCRMTRNPPAEGALGAGRWKTSTLANQKVPAREGSQSGSP